MTSNPLDDPNSPLELIYGSLTARSGRCLGRPNPWAMRGRRLDQGGSEATWDDRSYQAIVRAALEAEDEGELFRAEIALAIHLLHWNYTLSPDDLEDLLDDHGESRRRADLSHALSTLAQAHFRPLALSATSDPGQVSQPRRDDLRRVIGHTASQIFRWRVPREANGSIDLNV